MSGRRDKLTRVVTIRRADGLLGAVPGPWRRSLCLQGDLLRVPTVIDATQKDVEEVEVAASKGEEPGKCGAGESSTG